MADSYENLNPAVSKITSFATLSLPSRQVAGKKNLR
jgi:hypothetical protein